jgi:methionine-rich copper-binding protein CopC
MKTLVRVAGATLLVLLPVSSAFGHAELTEAIPGPDAVVAVAPAELVARFSQDLRADRTSIELRDPAGQTIAAGGKDPDKARVQRMPLPTLIPGEYEVRWVSYSAEDDELARGRYRFSVIGGAASPTPAIGSSPPCPAASAAPSPDVSPLPLVSPTPAASAEPLAGASPVPVDPCASPAPSPTDPLAPSPSPSPSPLP